MEYFKILTILCVIIDVTISVPSCGLYGSPPCSFLPAPPGHTPSCAGPGKTYCEHVSHYPMHVIKHLIHSKDVKGFITDETRENFNSVGYHRTPISHFYGQPQSNQLNSYTQNTDGYKYGPENGGYISSGYNSAGLYNEEFPDPIYIPRPNNNGYNINNNVYNTQQQQYSNGGYYYPTQSHYNSAENFKRYVRELSKQNQQRTVIRISRKSRSINENLLDNTGNVAQKIFLDKITNDAVKSRQKRQSPGRNILCQTRNSYIQPQAALSSRGNWMFVVNQVETSQLVKTETCASNVCSNLCQIPNGYNSRCEQKYVQKRLVALEGTGQRLYTDTFWFPSCCVCTISNN